MHDPDVPKNLMPSGNFDHWMLWDIAPASKGIAEGAGSSMGMNGTGKAGYIGPCPPDREHRYFFKLYTLDTTLDLPSAATKVQVEGAMKGHILAEGQLMGSYGR